MIRDIKKYNVWIVYVCMWLFSFFTVWYIAIVMYYTLVHVTQSGYASDFIKNISTLSNVPIRSFYIAVFGFIGLFCFVSIRKKIRFFSHHQIIPILIELGLSLLIMKNISFSATCILFLIIADSLLYVDKPVDRSICIILVFLAYMLSNYGYLSNYIPMISFLKNVSTSKNVTKYIQEDAPLDSSYNLEFFDDMMEQAITIKKLDGYDQLYSMADSEIRRVIGTNEDIESAMQNLNDELNILLEKQ